MSEPIKVGDLVMIVRSGTQCRCASIGASNGTVFSVADINYTALLCLACRFEWGPVWCALDKSDGLRAELFRLKLIPPLGELEGADSWEELNTPVLL